MKLQIRYEDKFQTIELDAETTEQLWVSLSLEDEGLSQEEREQRIQEEWERQYNRPEYNVWHRETRHIDGNPKRRRMDGRSGYIRGDSEDPTFQIMDYLLTTSDEESRDAAYEYEEICEWVRKVLERKPNWAAAFVAVRLDGVSVNDYAASIGVSDASIVSKWLARAEKKLREKYPDRQI